jgi:hypothetical protein
MSQWYYAHDGKQSGPVPESELQRLAADGNFDPEKDLVWREGQPDWKPASTVPELASLFRKENDVEPAAPAASGAESSPYEAPRSPAGPPQQAPHTQVAVPQRTGLSVAALICGLVGLISCFMWCLSIPLALAGIVCGHIALSRIKSDPVGYGGRGLALTGTIAGYLALVLNIAFIAIIGYLSNLSPEKLEELGVPREFIEQMESQRKMQEQMQKRMEE